MFAWIEERRIAATTPPSVYHFQRLFEVPVFLKKEDEEETPPPTKKQRKADLSIEQFYAPALMFRKRMGQKKLNMNRDDASEKDCYPAVNRKNLFSDIHSKRQIIALRKELGLHHYKNHGISVLSLHAIVNGWMRKCVKLVLEGFEAFLEGFDRERWFTTEEWWREVSKDSKMLQSLQLHQIGLILHYYYSVKGKGEEEEETITSKSIEEAGLHYLHQWLDSMVERSEECS